MSPKEIAMQMLDEEVECQTTKQVGSCSITVWLPLKGYPPVKVAICDNGSEIYAITGLNDTLQKFVQDVRPSLHEIEEVTSLLNECLPVRFRILSEKTSEYVKSMTDNREPPHFDGEGFVFFCNDFGTGTVLRCQIDGEYRLTCTAEGEGVRMDIA